MLAGDWVLEIKIKLSYTKEKLLVFILLNG